MLLSSCSLTKTHSLVSQEFSSPENPLVPVSGSSADEPIADAQAILPTHGKLSIATAVESALRHNVETQIFRAREQAADAQIDLAQSEFDLNLSAEGRTRQNSLSPSDVGYQADKRFITGGQVQFEGGSRFNENEEIREELSEVSSSEYGIRIRQPLLRGAGVKYNRSSIDRAKLVAKAADIQTQAQILELLRAAETSYWAASIFQHQLQGRVESVERTRKLLEDVQAQKELGTATRIDILEAESSLAESRAELVRARKLYQDEMDNLRFLLGADFETNGEWHLEVPTRYFDQRKSPSVEAVIANAMANAPEIALLLNDIEQRKIDAYRAKRDKLPRLDLELDAAYDDDNNSSGSSGSSSDSALETIGLVRVSMPWGNRERRALYEQAEAQLNESQLTKTNSERRLKQRIFEAARSIDTGREELAVATQAHLVNRQIWEEQLRRSKEGLVSTRILRETEEDLRLAENAENNARLRLIAAWSLLSQLDGSIADRLGVTFHS